jgi:hypothetical protein
LVHGHVGGRIRRTEKIRGRPVEISVGSNLCRGANVHGTVASVTPILADHRINRPAVPAAGHSAVAAGIRAHDRHTDSAAAIVIPAGAAGLDADPGAVVVEAARTVPVGNAHSVAAVVIASPTRHTRSVGWVGRILAAVLRLRAGVGRGIGRSERIPRGRVESTVGADLCRN